MTTKCSECGGDHSPEIHTLDGALMTWSRLALDCAKRGALGSIEERLAMSQVRLLWRREAEQ